MNNNTINDFIRWGIYGLVGLTLLTPFIVADSIYFPFIGGKVFFFRLIVEIAFFLWIILFLRDRDYLPKSSTLLVCMSFFILSLLVSTFLGENFIKSFWSNYERMEGWIMIVHLYIYFLVLISVIRNKKDWHILMNVSMVVATIIAISAFFQFVGFNPIIKEWFPSLSESFAKHYPVHQSGDRLDARLGNAIYMAVYMIMHLFVAGYLFYNAEDKTIKGGKWLSIFYSVFAIVSLFIIFHTLTRGAILGTVAGLLVSAITVAIWANGKVRKAGIVGIGVVFLASTLFILNRDAEFVQNNPTLRRMATISWSDTKTQARSFIWPMAIEGAFEKPIFGWGQENFNYIFNEKYNPLMYGHEKWFDRAHSVYVDWLVAGGVVGLALYLSLYLLAFVYIYKSDLSIPKKAALYGLVVGYGIHNIFAFDNISSYILFFFILGFIHHIRTEKVDYIEPRFGKKITDYLRNLYIHEDIKNYLIIPTIFILLIVISTFSVFIPMGENQALAKVTRSCDPKTFNFEKQLKIIERKDKLFNTELGLQEAREQTILCVTNAILSWNIDEKNRIALVQLADKAIEDQITDTPDDVRIYFFAGGFWNRVGNYEKALPYTKRGHELSPGKQQLAFEYIQTLLNLGGDQNTKLALDLASNTYNSAPEYKDAKAVYASALLFSDEVTKFDDLTKGDIEVLSDSNVINTLALKNMYHRIERIYKELSARDPNNLQVHFSLTAVYLKMNRRTDAINELRKALEKEPSLKEQVEKTIESILDGSLKI